jgi:hypothetical protein
MFMEVWSSLSLLPGPFGLRRKFKEEIKLLTHRETRQPYAGFSSWFDNFF